MKNLLSRYQFLALLKTYCQFYAVFVCILLASAEVVYANSVVTVINQVDMLESSEALPPADSLAWQSSKLPYKSTSPNDRRVINEKYIWFRFTLTNQDPLSLYIANYYFNVAIFLNGNAIGGSFANADKQAVGLIYPIFVDTRAQWKPQQENIFHVRLSYGAPMALMSEIHVANTDMLQALWKDKVLKQIAASLGSVIICILLAIFTFGLWLRRKQDTAHLIFSALAASWCVTMFYVLLPFSPIEHSIR